VPAQETYDLFRAAMAQFLGEAFTRPLPPLFPEDDEGAAVPPQPYAAPSASGSVTGSGVPALPHPGPATPAAPGPHWQEPIPHGAGGPDWEWHERPSAANVNPFYHVVHKGTGERLFGKTPEIYSNVGRTGLHNAAEVGTERAAHHILNLIGVPHLPAQALTERGGRPALLSRLVTPPAGYANAPSLDAALNTAHPNYTSTLRTLVRSWYGGHEADAIRMLFGNWLVNAGDRHAGNYLIGSGGTVVPIDYGPSFLPHLHNQEFWRKAESLRKLNPAVHSENLPRDILERTLMHKDEIRKLVEDLVVPHFGVQAPASWHKPEHHESRQQLVRDVLEDKLATVRKLIDRPAPRVADLGEDRPAYSRLTGEFLYKLGII